MSILAILYWVILVLAVCAFFVPVDTYPRAWMSNLPALVLFVLIGLKVFRTPIQ
jgi:hypothetical protein